MAATRKKRAHDPMQLGVRVDRQVVAEFDKIAADLGLSRTQLLGRVMRDVVRMNKATKEGGLFAEWGDELAEVIEKAMQQAMRTGGIDAVIHGAKEAEKVAKKKGRW